MVIGMQATAFVIIAILAVSLLAARELVRAAGDARRSARAIDFAKADMMRCFDATERALSNERVPAILKKVLLNQASALAYPGIGKPLIKGFVARCHQGEIADPKLVDPIGEAIDALSCIDPSLASDCRAALSQGVLALLFMHADKFNVEEAASEVVRSPSGVPSGLGQLFGGPSYAAPA